MQSLDIISVNLWHIVISLCNLLILFFVLKKFLYKPVENVAKQRKDELAKRYNDAEQAKAEALSAQKEWENRMHSAEEQADEIVKSATEKADYRSRQMLDEAREKASGIMRQAKTEAELEKKKATAEIKKEITDVSAVLAEKLLQRELDESDHARLIDSVIDEIGDNYESDN